MRSVLVSALLVGAIGSAAHAQSVGVGVKLGTLGIGGDLGVQLHQRIGVRGGIGFTPYTPAFTISEIKYTVDLPSPQITGMLDLFLVGPLRLTGGILVSTPDVIVNADLTGSTTQADVGGQTFTGSDVGVLTGVIINKDLAPYAGIGIGRVGGKGFGFFMDIGVAFQGKPTVDLSASGGTLAGDPIFTAALDAEEGLVADAVDLVKYWPVVQLGFRYGF
ncbi:MAG TPA: hypothetical protein VGA22_04325 [Gemmatimonadales bacterium]|jgi:hypothetical protein